MAETAGPPEEPELDDEQRERLEEQRARMSEIERRNSLTADDLVIAGFEDKPTTQMIKMRRGFRGRTTTLRPALPLLLTLKGKPYRLHDYFPFEPFFRTRMAKATLLKTGRQVSKSTSLAAQGVVFSNSIPHFSTLYVTPLFEMIRRFSHNYVRQFLEGSPLKKQFIGSKSLNSVLQRTFTNGSAMYFSYAFLDAERTRGIPADKNCLVAGTLVELWDGRRIPIEAVLPGTVVVSADKNGSIVEDTVTDRIYQGVQDVFEVTFRDGSRVRCTRDERFRRNDGKWVNLDELLSGQTSPARRSAVELLPDTDAVGLFVRGLGDRQLQRDGLLADRIPTRRPTDGLLLAQSRTSCKLRHDAAFIEAERRLGRDERRVQHGVQRSVLLPRNGDYRPSSKEGHAIVDVDSQLGGDRLLADGRRHQASKQDLLLHAWLLSQGGEVARGETATDGSCVGQSLPCEGEEPHQVHHKAVDRRLAGAIPSRRRLGTFEHALQVSTRTLVSDLLDLPGAVPRPKRSGRGQRPHLRRQRVPACTSSFSGEAQFDAQAAAGEEQTGTTSLRGEVCGVSTIERVTYLGRLPVWDLNTRKEHAFFADGVLVHNCIDEVQDMNHDFLQIIHETLSGSPYGLKQYAGTPKSMDNTMEVLWQDSSQAEWIIKCRQPGCGHWNYPTATLDLYDMIGPWHKGICEKTPGVVCAKCRKPLNPRTGRWSHRYPERRWSFAGYHVPQIIMPLHYASQEKWDVLVGKQNGKGNTTPTTFLNEVCGESCDTGSKLVTQSDLQAAACLPWRRRAKEATEHIPGPYLRRILAVDWGGGGGRLSNSKKTKAGETQRLRTSFTSMAVLGLRPDDRVDVIWGHRSVRTHDFAYEAGLCVEAMNLFRCSHIAHDYSNAGAGRIYLLYQAGVPESQVINIRYHGPGHNVMVHHAPSEDNPDTWYSLDRSVSLVTTCMCIKTGLIRFFKYDYESADSPGLLHDFLSLIEEKIDSRIATDNYVIARNPNKPDDFAHAVNYGCCALWWMTNKWPNIAEAAKFRIEPDLLKRLNPQGHVDWNDVDL